MTVHSDGIICYGVSLRDDQELPWQRRDAGYDGIESWWRAINGYQPPYLIYDANGNYRPGFQSGDMRVAEYYKHRFEWERAHPLPFTLVKHCSDEDPAYILALPATVLSAWRGQPKTFDPLAMALMFSATEDAALIAFCAQHDIAYADQPRWWLASYWG